MLLLVGLVGLVVVRPAVSRILFNPIEGGGAGGLMVLAVAAFIITMLSFQVVGPAVASAVPPRGRASALAIVGVLVTVAWVAAGVGWAQQ